MKKLALAAAAFVLLVLPASAQTHYPYAYGSDPSCAQPDEGNLQRHDCYRNSDGNSVHRPSPTIPHSPPPLGATAQCADGTYSFSQHRSGTCSHHGGIAR